MRIHHFIPASFAGSLLLLGVLGTPSLADTPPVVDQWPAKPPSTPVDFKKPANFLQTADYTLRVQTSPPVIKAGKPLTLHIDLLNSSGTGPLATSDLGEGPLHLVIMDKQARHAWHLHPNVNADGNASFEFTLPYSGMHNIFVVFQPAGKATMTERIPVWVENVAVNGKDTTSYRLTEGYADTRPASHGIGPSPEKPAAHHFTSDEGYTYDFDPTTDFATTSEGTLLKFRVQHAGQVVTDMNPKWVWVVPDGTEQIYVAIPQDGPIWRVTMPTVGRYHAWAEYATPSGGSIIVPLDIDYGMNPENADDDGLVDDTGLENQKGHIDNDGHQF